MVATALLFKLVQNLIESGILSPYLLGYLHLFEFKLSLQELALSCLKFSSQLIFLPLDLQMRIL
jgi:hypothetical protein